MTYRPKYFSSSIEDDSLLVIPGGIDYAPNTMSSYYENESNSNSELDSKYETFEDKIFNILKNQRQNNQDISETSSDEIILEDDLSNTIPTNEAFVTENYNNSEYAKKLQDRKKRALLNPQTQQRLANFENEYDLSGIKPEGKQFFIDLAFSESGGNFGIKNEKAPAFGAFQFMQGKYGNTNYNNIGHYANVSTDEFLTNPRIQLKAAEKLAKEFLNSFNNEDFTRAEQLGYTQSAMLAGAGLGGAKNVKRYLKNQSQNAADVNGTSIKQYMDTFNNYFKHGGVIKFGDGGKDDGLSRGGQFIDEWYDSRTDLLAKNFNEQYPWLLTNGNLINNLIKINLSNINSYVDSNKVPNGAKGVYRPNRKELVISDPNDTSTAIHEYAHGVTEFNDSIINKVSDIISGMGSGLYMNSSIKPDAYLDDPAEIYSRLMQLRHFLSEEGIDPKKKFTVDDVRNLIDTYTNKTHLHNSNGITTFDSSGNIIRHDPTKSAEDWKIERSVDYRVGDLDLLFRYNPYITTKLLNEVAILPKTSNIQKAQNGLKVVTQDSQNNGVLSEDWHAPLLPIYVNSIPDADSSVKGFNNAKDVYEHILTLPGSNPAIAAGGTGVFMKESGLDHNAVNKSSGARGIAQLLGSRRNEYKRGLNGKSDTGQNQISWVWEKINNGTDDGQTYYDALKKKVDNGESLSTDEQSHGNSMSKSKYINYSFKNYRDTINSMYDPGDIAELMTGTFERPGDKEAHIDQRRDYANSVYNQFNY